MIPLVAALISAGLPLLADAVASKGKQLVEDKLGIKLPSVSPETPSLTPEQVTALKKIEADKEVSLRELAVRELEAEVDNNKNARGMQVAALSSDSDMAKNFIYYFALLWTILASVYIYGITFTEVPKGNERYIDLVLGFLLGTALSGVFQFFFGSSIRNKDKDQAINDLAKRSATA